MLSTANPYQEIIDWLHTPEGERWSEARMPKRYCAWGQVSLTRYGDELSEIWLGGVVSVKPG